MKIVLDNVADMRNSSRMSQEQLTKNTARVEGRISSMIANRVAVVAKYDRVVAFNVVRRNGKIRLQNAQTGKLHGLEFETRFDMLAQVQSRYTGGVACYSTPKRIYINPLSVAKFCGMDMALSLLIEAGLVTARCRVATVIQPFDSEANQ